MACDSGDLQGPTFLEIAVAVRLIDRVDLENIDALMTPIGNDHGIVNTRASIQQKTHGRLLILDYSVR